MRPSSLFFLATALIAFAAHAEKGAAPKPSPKEDVSESGGEKLSLGFNLGMSLPVTVNGAGYSAFPTLGVDAAFRPIPWIGVGLSTQENLFIPSAGSGVLLEGGLFPEVLFYAADTGFYAGIRAGLVSIYDSYTNAGNGTSYAFGWGPKVGYQYHFSGSRFAIGPEWSMVSVSSSSHSNDTYTVTVPSHTVHNLVVVAKWWLF